jgi:hypothetical protein
MTKARQMMSMDLFTAGDAMNYTEDTIKYPEEVKLANLRSRLAKAIMSNKSIYTNSSPAKALGAAALLTAGVATPAVIGATLVRNKLMEPSDFAGIGYRPSEEEGIINSLKTDANATLKSYTHKFKNMRKTSSHTKEALKRKLLQGLGTAALGGAGLYGLSKLHNRVEKEKSDLPMDEFLNDVDSVVDAAPEKVQALVDAYPNIPVKYLMYTGLGLGGLYTLNKLRSEEEEPRRSESNKLEY